MIKWFSPRRTSVQSIHVIHRVVYSQIHNKGTCEVRDPFIKARSYFGDKYLKFIVVGYLKTPYIRVYLQQHFFDGLGQPCSIFIANALGILQSCTKPSIYGHRIFDTVVHISNIQLRSMSMKCSNNIMYESHPHNPCCLIFWVTCDHVRFVLGCQYT